MRKCFSKIADALISACMVALIAATLLVIDALPTDTVWTSADGLSAARTFIDQAEARRAGNLR